MATILNSVVESKTNLKDFHFKSLTIHFKHKTYFLASFCVKAVNYKESNRIIVFRYKNVGC